MEIPNFLIWATVVFGIGGFAIGSMISAFRQPITQAPFPDTVIDKPSIPLSQVPLETFCGAVGTYRAGDYRRAIEQFTQVIETDPQCAEAWHNVGFAYANIGDNNKAVRSFLKASDAYAKQDTKAGLDQIQQALKTLKATD